MYINIKCIGELKNIQPCKIIIQVFLYLVRKHKNIYFLSVRKNHIFIQCIVKNKELFDNIDNIPLEAIINIKGFIYNREKQNINPDLELGDKEICIENIECIKSKKIEFNVRNSHLNTEEINYENRILHLRNEFIFQDIVFRSKVVKSIRNFFDSKEFIEIQTPILSNYTPEGANDYIVLTRKHPNHCYTLPQSPQIYKQLLMYSDFSKYYQIAPCFRDEDSRQNRISTEFYQVDIEMYATKQDEIISLCNELIMLLIKTYTNKTVSIKYWSYDEAIKKYGSDKVDIRVIEVFKLHIIEEYIHIEDIHNINCLCTQYKDIYKKENIITFHIKHKYKKEIFLFLSSICNQKLETNSIVWIHSYPMYEQNKDKEWDFSHNPFSKYYPKGFVGFDDMNISEQKNIIKTIDISQIYTYQYDMIFNGEEVGGGSIRNINSDLLYTVFEKINKTELFSSFSHLSKAMEYNNFQHGGIAFGLERLLCLLTDTKKIKKYIPFPYNQQGASKFFNVPQPINKEFIVKNFFKKEEENKK